jgi:hypothetical protein
MLLETIRMVTDALNSSVYGVNTKLAGLSIDSTDSVPTSLAAIVDETRSDEVAVGRTPNTYPLLAVTLDGDTSLNGFLFSEIRDGSVTLVIRYITESQNAAVGNSEAFYVLRAVQQTLADFVSNDNASDRVRNNVLILEMTELQHVNMFENINDALVVGALKPTFRVRDIAP